MRVACVGGPGGLFFAALLKRGRPGTDVVVFERNRPDDTFGFGVIFSDETFGVIDVADPERSDALGKIGRHWNEIEVRVHGARECVGGMGMAATTRGTLLSPLQERARGAGVTLRFQHEVRHPRELADFDLVVVSDGADSRCGEMFADDFGATSEVADAKFIWFGASCPFDLLTFVVQTDAASWAMAGLDEFDTATPAGPSDEKTKAYLEQLFADQIDRHRLVGNTSRWGNFATRRTVNWRRDNWVLLGDAARTTHFSVGSGTKAAMEDAVTLADALAASPTDVSSALEIYEAFRRPPVELIQNSARPSLSWWENFGGYVRVIHDPVQFAFHFLTRGVSRGELALRDRRYVERVDTWWHDWYGAAPLDTPFRTGAGRLPSRRVTAIGDDGATLVGSDGTRVRETAEGGRAADRGTRRHPVDARPGLRGGPVHVCASSSGPRRVQRRRRDHAGVVGPSGPCGRDAVSFVEPPCCSRSVVVFGASGPSAQPPPLPGR